MGQELGLQGLTIPEEYGGQGFTFIELWLVLEEMGGALLCAPFFSSVVLAANALLTSGDDEPRRPACRASRGATRSRRWPSPSRREVGRSGITMEATKNGDGWVLNGQKMFVIDGHVPTSSSSPPAPRPTASRSSRCRVTPPA